jgi:hypothetical protein
MASKTITVTEKAYRTLARCKEPGESFTQTIERIAGDRILTVGDLKARVKACAASGEPIFGSHLKPKARTRSAA